MFMPFDYTIVIVPWDAGKKCIEFDIQIDCNQSVKIPYGNWGPRVPSTITCYSKSSYLFKTRLCWPIVLMSLMGSSA